MNTFVPLLVLLLLVLLDLFVSVSHAQKQCPTAPVSPQDRRTDKSLLTIATYNAEWLFLTGTNCPGSGCVWKTKEQAMEHLAAVAAEIVIINADILNMVEVQDCSVLTTLNELLDNYNMSYKPYLLTGTDTSTGQNVALLTRIDPYVTLKRTDNRVAYPIPTTKCVSKNSGTSAVSKHYYTYFNVDGLKNPLSILGMHFLAFPDDQDRCVQREAQATVIAGLVASQAIPYGHSVVVMGDLNDFDDTIKDCAGSVPISSVLDILRDPVTNTPGDELFNVAKYVPVRSTIYSNWYDRQSDCIYTSDELTLIDHVLLSNDLASLVDHAWMDHSYAPLCQTLESDHWPVIVRLDLTKAQPPHVKPVTEI